MTGTTPIHATAAAYHSRVLGVGGFRPSRVVTNDEICQHIDSSDQWIRERSGIEERRFAAADDSVLDLAEPAARDALAMAGITPGELDAILFATVTHPYQLPAAAAFFAGRLGASCPALDLSAACAGYCYGIALAHDMVRSGSARHVLVIGAEKLTDFIDREDRSIAFIFGDGAGAAVIGRSETPGIGPTIWGTDGSATGMIDSHMSWLEIQRGLVASVEGAGDALATDESDPVLSPQVAPRVGHTFRMQGPSVFRWASYTMPKVALQAVAAAGLTLNDIDVFIPHQANLRIIDAMVKSMKLPDRVVVATDIVDSGNTSSASVPLATARLLAEGRARSGQRALQFGFGAGLVWAAQVIELP